MSAPSVLTQACSYQCVCFVCAHYNGVSQRPIALEYDIRKLHKLYYDMSKWESSLGGHSMPHMIQLFSATSVYHDHVFIQVKIGHFMITSLCTLMPVESLCIAAVCNKITLVELTDVIASPCYSHPAACQ